MKPDTVRDTAVHMKQIKVMIAGMIIPLVFHMSASGINAAGPGRSPPAEAPPALLDDDAPLAMVTTVYLVRWFYMIFGQGTLT